jgi:DNA mismatch endonuclease, patch repair protein
MRRVRTKDTRPELLLRQALWAVGLRYRLGLRMTGNPDLVFLRAKVAVFVDGCFWHGCPLHYTVPERNAAFWGQKLSRNLARDITVNEQLNNAGWTVVRVWEHELDNDLVQVVRKIEQAVHGDPRY